MLGMLYYQVHNGGFVQWVDNGYGTRIDEVIDILEDIGGPYSQQVQSMLEEIEPYIADKGDSRGFNDGYWHEEIFEEWVEGDCWEEEVYVGKDEDGNEIYDYEEICDDGYYEESEPYIEGIEIAENMDRKFYAISEKWAYEVIAYLSFL